MNIVYGAEHHNWLLEQEGVIKVVMTDGMTEVTFDDKDHCEMAFTNVNDYEMNHYSMCENILLLLPNV